MLKEENVKIDEMFGHGGFFKTKGVGQRIAAAPIDAPVSVMETAGEGGAWGIAVLAAYLIGKSSDEKLGDYLNKNIFADQKGSKLSADAEDVAGFNAFMDKYKAGLAIEHAAVDAF